MAINVFEVILLSSQSDEFVARSRRFLNQPPTTNENLCYVRKPTLGNIYWIQSVLLAPADAQEPGQ